MKKKRIALLLAAVMTLSSISSTAAFASGVDASKEIAGQEQETETLAEVPQTESVESETLVEVPQTESLESETLTETPQTETQEKDVQVENVKGAREIPEVTSAEVDISSANKEFMAGLESCYLDSGSFFINYEGTEEREYFSFIKGQSYWTDSYGNSFSYYFKAEDGYEYSAGSHLPEGTYQVVIYCNGNRMDTEGDTQVTAGVQNMPLLSVGDNENVQTPNEYAWYRFTAPETGKYIFGPVSSIEVYQKYDDDREKVSGEGRWDEEGYQYTCSLTKGETYYILLSDSLSDEYGEEIEEYTLNIRKMLGVSSVKIKSYAPENLSFAEKAEKVQLSTCEVEVTYEDGTTETFDQNNKEDAFGRTLKWRLFGQKDEQGEYPEADSQKYPQAGNYVYRVSFDGIYSEDEVPVEVKPLSELVDAEIKTEKTNLDNQERLILKYTAKETGRYEFKFNVPVSKVKVVSAEGERLKNTSVEKYGAYANLEKDATYYLYVSARKDCSKLQITTSLVSRLSGLKATALKKTYIADLDEFSSRYMQAEVSHGTSEKRTVKGSGEVDGYYLQYRAEKQVSDAEDQEVAYDGYTLSEGTWNVTPYLSASIQTGSAVAVEMSDIPVQSATIKADKLDLSKLPILQEDQWTAIPNTYGERKFYSFTAQKEGYYEIEQEQDNVELELYRIEENGYDERYNRVYLDEGESALIVMRSEQSEKIRLFCADDDSDPDEPEQVEEVTLTDGKEREVTLSNGYLKGTFTPQQDGFYVLESSSEDLCDTYAALYCEGREIARDDDSGKDMNFMLRAELVAGKTYEYQVRLYSNYEKEERNFRLAFFRSDTKKIQSVRLVPYDGMTFDLFHYFEDAYFVEVTYEDQTKENIYSMSSGIFKDKRGNTVYYKAETNGQAGQSEIDYAVTLCYQNEQEDTEHEVTQTVKRKGFASLQQIVEGQKYSVDGTEKYYWFSPKEDGEYLYRMTGMTRVVEISEQKDTFGIIDILEPDEDGYIGNIKYMEPEYQGDTGYSIYLKAGKNYLIKAFDKEKKSNTFEFHKIKKVLNGLELIDAPEQKTCLPDGINALSLKGMKVKASYTDGTTEIISYGETDSDGRYLYHGGVTWIHDNLCRAYVNLGNYQVSFDLTAASMEDVRELKCASPLTVKAEKGDVLVLKFIPEADGVYQATAAGGKVWSEIRGADAEDDRSASNALWNLKKGKVYYLYVTAEQADLTVAINLGKQECSWKQTDRKEATCTEKGLITETCSVHGETRTTEIPARGHQMGAWKTTREATAVLEGIQERSCSVCGGAKETRTIAKLQATIELNVPTGKALPLRQKQAFQLKVSGLAKGDAVASFSVDKPKVLSVSAKGKIKGKKSGTATVTILLKSGLTTKLKVKVQKKEVTTASIQVKNAATGAKIGKTVKLKPKKKLRLSVTVAPATSKQKVTYTSSNKKIAQINGKGVITAKKKGTTKITVKSGKKTVRIKVQVK
jgi:hypothetical protein